MKTAILFPGQGAQIAGMGQDVFQSSKAAKTIFEEADNALGESLSTLCFDGPQEQLNLTANTQPALLATSAALTAAVMERTSLEISCVAGHSLGEYTALWFAGALDIQTAVSLVRRRGQAMQDATPAGVGAMAAVIGLNKDKILEVCQEAADQEVLTAANFNAPGQVVISGDKSAVQRGIELAREKGARKSVLLPVSAPFHCPLMQPAADVMANALKEADVKSTEVPVICNVTAKEMGTSADEIRHALIEQVTGAVQWEESIRYMAESGIELFIEIGPGKVLTNMAKRIAPGVKRLNVSNLDGIQKLIDFLGNES